MFLTARYAVVSSRKSHVAEPPYKFTSSENSQKLLLSIVLFFYILSIAFQYHSMHTSIAIDKITRDRAAKRAQTERMPLAVVVRIFLTDYAEGRLSIGTRTRTQHDVPVETIAVDRKTQKKMDAITKQWGDRIGT